ncbi:MLO-like protein 9 [Benincasa hispida]|uniref:MLO-like protein 9 n=1 Tax=Benincasa hispida TaxID=102211 RepID=UPI0019029C08|nr:MLO-like protein 9 [Benincasa hispida]
MGGGGGGGAQSRELDQTPTWAVAAVCAVIILISIILEKVLHMVGELFQKRKKKALFEALEKVKGELMVLGFISLLLTFGQNYIAKVCIPSKYANTMLPCPYRGASPKSSHSHGIEPKDADEETLDHHRRLLWYEHRRLAGSGPVEGCKPGYTQLISLNGLHQIHIFIFFLAVLHVVFSGITMTLGRLKIRGWKVWERQTEQEHDAMNDPTRFRLTHETSFVRDHSSFWTKTPLSFYFVCFWRQFFRSVSRADYLSLRHGFVTVHLAPGSKFDFQKYIKRSLEDDFKVVVGISPLLWASMVLFLLLNVSGWQVMFWLSIFPLVVILAVGTKLQGIITQMALEIKERHAVVQGIPLVQVSDRHFWFSWPVLVLYLIHYVLFQNAFEITYFFWIWYEFGLRSCFHDNFDLIIVRVALGVGVQILCSYITLPLYALVTQMGSTMKKSIFDEQTSKALKQWHRSALKKKNEGGKPDPPPTRTLGGGSGGRSPPESPMQSSHEFQHQSVPQPSPTDVEASAVPSADIMATIDLQQQQNYANRDLLS